MPTWVPLAVLFAAAAYLAFRWDAIPTRWVTHWNAAGTPNGWAVRTPSGVFGPLVLGGAVVVFVRFISAIARGRANTATALEPVRAATSRLVAGVGLAVALVFAFLAIELPLGPPLSPAALGVATLLVFGAAMAVGAAGIARALREVRHLGHGEKVEGHHAFYYANANDPRLWVPKLSGMGYTLNFANPWSWPTMLLLVGVPIGLVLVDMVGAHSR